MISRTFHFICFDFLNSSLRPVSFTSFSCEKEVECLSFWVRVSIWSNRIRRSLKTLSKVGWFESVDIWRNRKRSHLKRCNNNNNSNNKNQLGAKNKAKEISEQRNDNELKLSDGNTSVLCQALLAKREYFHISYFIFHFIREGDPSTNWLIYKGPSI